MSQKHKISLSKDIISTLIVVGISMIFLLFLIYLARKFAKDITQNTWFADAVNFIAKHGMSVFLSMLLFCVCITILGFAFDWFWHKYVHPTLEDYKNIIAEEIQKNKNSLEQNLQVFRTESEELLKDNLLQSVVVRSDSKYVKKNLSLIHGKAFGSHCDNRKGLYGEIQNSLYPFLRADRPHRSQHNQTITVTQDGDNTVWSEVTRFELHVIALDDDYVTRDEDLTNLKFEDVACIQEKDNQELPNRAYVEHVLKMKTGGLFTNLSNMSFKIEVDGEEMFDLQQAIELKGENQIVVKDNFKQSLDVSQHDSGYISFSIHLALKLKKAMTRVQIFETSFLDSKDNFFVVRRVEPSYGAVLAITLPEKWKILSFTVPDEIKWGSPNSQLEKSPQCRMVVADINGWVMPGIIACCTWERS